MTSGPPARDRLATSAVLGAVVAAGLVLRLVHLRAVLPLVDAEGAPVGMDRWLNTQIATAIVRGSWDGGWAAAYDSSPAYSYLLAGLWTLFGGSWNGPLVLQVVLGALAPLLLYDVGRRLYSPAVGVLAAVLAALYLPAVFYEGLLVKFALVPFAGSVVLLTAVRTRAAGRAGIAAVAGIALGVLALLRPNTAIAAPVVLGWAAWGHSLRAAARMGAAAALGAALVLVPMAVRDRVAAEHGLAGSLWGIHFYIGNHPAADGEYVTVPGVRPDPVGHVIDARAIAERETGQALDAAAVSRWWFARGLLFVREHPVRWIALELRKIWLAFAAGERGSFGDEFGELRHASPVLRLPLVGFGVVAPLGIVGLVATVRRRGPMLLPLLVAAYTVSLLPFFIVGRYRLPIAPPMIVLAAVGLARVAAWASARRRRVPALAGAFAGLAVLAVALGAGDADLLALLATVVVGLPVAAEEAGHSFR